MDFSFTADALAKGAGIALDGIISMIHSLKEFGFKTFEKLYLLNNKQQIYIYIFLIIIWHLQGLAQKGSRITPNSSASNYMRYICFVQQK